MSTHLQLNIYIYIYIWPINYIWDINCAWAVKAVECVDMWYPGRGSSPLVSVVVGNRNWVKCNEGCCLQNISSSHRARQLYHTQSVHLPRHTVTTSVPTRDTRCCSALVILISSIFLCHWWVINSMLLGVPWKFDVTHAQEMPCLCRHEDRRMSFPWYHVCIICVSIVLPRARAVLIYPLQ